MTRKSCGLAVLLFCLIAADAFAQSCPDIYGPVTVGSKMWYQYDIDDSCYSSSGSVTGMTVSCSGLEGWQFGTGWVNAVEFTFEVGNEVLNPDAWEASSFVYFNDPNDSIYNDILFTVTVTHPNSTQDVYTILDWNGPDGDLNGCGSISGGFSADTGDDVTVRIESTRWYSTTTIQANGAPIFSTNG